MICYRLCALDFAQADVVAVAVSVVVVVGVVNVAPNLGSKNVWSGPLDLVVLRLFLLLV